jgi:hypothetical protein
MGAKLTVALNYSMVNVCSEHISKVWARVTLTLDWVTFVTLTVNPVSQNDQYDSSTELGSLKALGQRKIERKRIYL